MGDVLSCFDSSVVSILRRGIHIRRGTRRRSGLQHQAHGEGHRQLKSHGVALLILFLRVYGFTFLADLYAQNRGEVRSNLLRWLSAVLR
jgi:hypothetical protein